jgi:hypothetical protein
MPNPHSKETMANSSFSSQKVKLDDACKLLRSFTLALPGLTQRDGIAGVERVNKQCDRIKKLFSAGPNAKQAAIIVAAARTRVAAAEARLAVLRKKAPG